MKVKLCSRELLRLSEMVLRAANGLERNATLSISNLLTFALLLFLADLSAGLTGPTSGAA